MTSNLPAPLLNQSAPTPTTAPNKHDNPLTLVYVLLYFPYFTETFIADEIAALRAQGHDVRIVSLLPPLPGIVQARSRSLLAHTVYAPTFWSWTLLLAQWHFLKQSPRLYLQLLRELLCQPLSDPTLRSHLKRVLIFFKAVWTAHAFENFPIDLYHSHFAWLPSAAARIAAKLQRKPFSITAHAYDVFSPKNELLPLVCKDAARIVAISEFNRAHILAETQCDSARVSVVHCGVDARRPVRARGLTRRKTVGTFRILSVGRLVVKKGHCDLIAACEILAHGGVEFSCTIIGGGPLEQSLRDQVAARGLSDRVTLRGAVAHREVLRALDAHDIFVLPCIVAPDGDQDGIPVALIEAAQAGMPIVSTNVSGIPELVRHFDTGCVVAPRKPIDVANAIVALASDPVLRQRLGRNASKLARRSFDITASAAMLSALFQEAKCGAAGPSGTGEPVASPIVNMNATRSATSAQRVAVHQLFN